MRYDVYFYTISKIFAIFKDIVKKDLGVNMRIVPLIVFTTLLMPAAYAYDTVTTPVYPTEQNTPTLNYPGTTTETSHPINEVQPPLPRSVPNTPISVQNPPDRLNPPNMQNLNYMPIPPADTVNPNTYSPADSAIEVVPRTQDEIGN